MPDGNQLSRSFQDPNRPLNLLEFTLECRKMVPLVLEMVNELLEHRADLTAQEQMALSVLVYDRAYGKPRNAPSTSLDREASQQGVTIYIPDNCRNDLVRNGE